ncbi:VOC family protein [Micromonospora luteifusca]|uniref:VOC family protein n=1 Tax=Micromonospora luteifusca TaxID=709860 RepID=UPI0033BE75DE
MGARGGRRVVAHRGADRAPARPPPAGTARSRLIPYCGTYVREKLVAAGVPAVQPPHDAGNNNRNALLRDPDGNLVEIVSKVS